MNNIAIVSGQYNNTERQQRYSSQFCKNMAEDPYHFYFFLLNKGSYDSKPLLRNVVDDHIFKCLLL
jgi:hypothetical protein